jgi:hypothetical protein
MRIKIIAAVVFALAAVKAQADKIVFPKLISGEDRFTRPMLLDEADFAKESDAPGPGGVAPQSGHNQAVVAVRSLPRKSAGQVASGRPNWTTSPSWMADEQPAWQEADPPWLAVWSNSGARWHQILSSSNPR